MKFNLLTNGVDSLKASYQRIEKMDELVDGIEHNIKDAIMYLNHANEILFKLMLKNQKEYLMFEDVGVYMKAKEAMIQQKKSNVLEINPHLKTVNFSTAIKRLELLCEVEFTPKFKGSLKYLNQLRNKIMHFEIELPENEVSILFEKLKICQNLSVEFFDKHLDGIDGLMQASRFEKTEEEYMEEMGEYQAEINYEDAYLDYIEGAYEDLGEGKW